MGGGGNVGRLEIGEPGDLVEMERESQRIT
jgi:hypothetical protein